MSNQSIIEHRGNYYYVEFREDYLILCLNCKYRKPDTEKSKSKGSPYCKALILAILEGWTNEKRDNKKSLAVFMTYPQWIDSLFGMFGRNVVIDSIDELLGEGLITRENYKMFGKDTWQYYLNYQEVNKRFKELPEREPHDRFPKVTWSHPSEDAVTNKRDDLPFTNKRIAVTNKRQTRLQVTDDPFTSNHNIESTNNHNIETDIEESIPDDPQNANSSPDGAILSQEMFQTLIREVQQLRADNQSLQEKVAKLSTPSSQLSTSFTQAQEHTTEEAGKHPIASETIQPELPSTPASSEKPKSRKPSTPKEEKPKVDVKRLQALLDSFIAVSREHFNQPDFIVELGSARSDNYKGALSIINIASSKGVRDVYQDFWDESDKNDPDTHWWRDPKHLTFKAFCRGYATRIASIQFNADNKTQKKSSQPHSVSGYRNYTLNPSSEAGETPIVTKQEEHPGPAPRRLQLRRVADIQTALENRRETVAAVAQ